MPLWSPVARGRYEKLPSKTSEHEDGDDKGAAASFVAAMNKGEEEHYLKDFPALPTCATAILQRMSTVPVATDASKPRNMRKHGENTAVSSLLDRVYVTHYTKTPSRLAMTSARLRIHGLAGQAVAVTSFDKEELTREIVDCFFTEDDSWPPLRPGEQSLGIKFYGALYDMVTRAKHESKTDSKAGSKPIENVLIVEDDIWMSGQDDNSTASSSSPSFDEYFADVLRALPADYDVVHLGDCLGYKNAWRSGFVATGVLKPASQHGKARIFEATNAPCSHAMLVSRAGALKLLLHALPITRPLDQHIEFYTKNVTLLRAYYSEHDLFWQESQQAPSGKLAESTGIRDRRLLLGLRREVVTGKEQQAGGKPERTSKTNDDVVQVALSQRHHHQQRNRFSCGECPLASASLPDQQGQHKFVHLHLTTTLGYGRTGNYVMAMQNAFKLAYLCKAVLELPAFDFQGNAFSFSSNRFFDFRTVKPRDALRAPECTNTANNTLYYWFLKFGTRTRHPSEGLPSLRYLPDVEDERVEKSMNVCLQRYLGICGDGDDVGGGGGGGGGGGDSGVVIGGGVAVDSGGDGSRVVEGAGSFGKGVTGPEKKRHQQVDYIPPFCRGLFEREQSDESERTVVAHVRHGDVYPSNFTALPVPLEYGQPPLSTYLSVFDFVNASRVILVGEPSSKGPVWKALKMLQANNALRYKVEFRSGNFRDDLRLMLCADTVVESRSTLMAVVRLGFASRIFTTEECFRPVVAGSAHVQKIYSCEASESYKKYYRQHLNEASEWVDALLHDSQAPRLCSV